jgi:heme o synthase
MKPEDSIVSSAFASFSDYVFLTKPRLTLLSVFTAVGSSYLALHGVVYYLPLVHTFIGTFLVGGAAGALNQYLERDFDAQMKRTVQRPLPSGRVQPIQALVFGLSLAVAGVLYLTLVSGLIAGGLALLTLISYLVVYTPLKRRTPFATIVGGIPGALPPLIGWAVARNELNLEAWSLFFILFFWQMPHFFALAWMYRKDYERAGYRILTVIDPSDTITPRQIMIYCIALVPASVLPTVLGLSGIVYFVGALVLSLGFLLMAIRLFQQKSTIAARKLFLSSLAFLPLLFFLLMAGL